MTDKYSNNHQDDYCNLSTLDEKPVGFMAVDDENWGVVHTLNDTGNIIITKDGNRHGIYIAGEHIASGWGFDSYTYMKNIQNIAGDEESSVLSYIVQNSDTMNTVIALYNKEIDDSNSDVIVDIPDEDTQIVVDGVVYKLANDDITGNLYFEKTCETEITNIVPVFADEFVLNDSPIVLKAGEDISVLEIKMDMKTSEEITHLNVFAKSYWDTVMDKSHYDFTPIEMNEESGFVTEDGIHYKCTLHTPYVDFDSVNSSLNKVPTLNGTSMSNNEDKIVIVWKFKDDPNDGWYFTESDTIYWQLPYFYGKEKPTRATMQHYSGNVEWRKDSVSDSMLETEISIQFDSEWENKEYGWFACPISWGTPRFVFDNSNLKHSWKLETSNVQYNINGTSIYYNVYCSPNKYYGDNMLTWKVIK